ncbi:protease [Rubrivirga sp.]|uniref:protease n=1 Tax=Rubrivirga sp. TaxID=1885344 RepID=UPI003B52384B
MTTVYWICLGGGVAVSVLLVVLGDLLEAAIDALDGALEAIDLGGAFDPLSAVFGVTLFGGAGLVLDAYTEVGPTAEIAIAAAVGLVAAVVLHTVYVKPMKASENSTGFSVREYAGKTGELTTGVPADGFGEVVVRMGASTTFQTAASFSGRPIPSGTAVVVVEVAADGVLRVAPLDTDDLEGADRPALPPRLQTH